MATKSSKELSEKDKQALRQKAEDRLYDAFLCLKTPDECSRFLRDICTPKEISDLTDRWWVARLLDEKKLSYREIRAQTGVSLTTISRVFRFLRQESFHGYQTVLERLRKKGE
jgi:TrpR-related protein YerC/YecD